MNNLISKMNMRVAMTLLVMMLTATTAWTQETKQDGNWTYKDYGTYAIISAYTGSDKTTLTSLTFPRQLDHLAVMGIASDFKFNEFTNLQTLNFYSNALIEEMPSVMNCSKLAQINVINNDGTISAANALPSSIERIPGNCFRGTVIRNIYMEGVISVGAGIFRESSSLLDVTIVRSASIEDGAFSYIQSSCTIDYPDMRSAFTWQKFAFSPNLYVQCIDGVHGWCGDGNDSAQDFLYWTIESRNLTIACAGDGWSNFQDKQIIKSHRWNDWATQQKKSIESITLSQVYALGTNEFKGMTGVTSVTLNDGLTSIGASAFEGCTGLSSITIPASVTSIGADAFKGCTKLTTVTILGNPTIAAGVFPSGVTVNLPPATAPTITTQPTGLNLTEGYESGHVLTVAASTVEGQTLSYQWYSNTTNSTTGGTAIDDATSESYTIPTGKTAGTYYYYCVVTATMSPNGQTATSTSNVATVTIASAEPPAIASVTTEGGETIEYASVEEAFEAVQNHDVLKLLADYNVPVDLENEKNGIVGVGNIYEQVFLTLDLNGHTLGFPDGGYLNVGPLIDLTVSGGTISGTANCIYNTGVLRLGNCTITATEGVGIAGNGELELHALPTFNCENEDIALEQDKLIYFVPGSYAVPEKKIKVSIKNTPPYLFTHQFDLCLTSNPEDVFVSTQYGDHAVGYCFFEGTYEAGIAGLTEITFPAGKSTYFDERALALYEANDKLKFYTVTDVDETNASVEVTEFDGKLFGQNAALIVSNETGAPVTAKFIEAFDGPMANYYTNLALDDLNGKYTYFGFEGTNVDLEEATDYEKQDPEKNYFYPIPGLTYYGFNGTGFVRLSRLGPIAAHRCWLGLGTPEVLGARSLTVNWPNGAPTGISDKGIVNSERFAAAEGWYGLDGRKLDGESVGKGIYIRRNGNKAEKLIIK